MSLLIGIALTFVGVVAFWMARPRDGKVAWFLKDERIQPYYVVALLGAVFVGVVNVVLGVITSLS